MRDKLSRRRGFAQQARPDKITRVESPDKVTRNPVSMLQSGMQIDGIQTMSASKSSNSKTQSKPNGGTARDQAAASPKARSAPAKAKTSKPVARKAKLERVELITTPAISKKLERGRFAMPQADFDRIALLKTRSKELGRPAKKNELLRAGLRALVMLSDEALLIALDQLETAKPAKRKRSSDI
jgi:hypothetical protein